MLVLTCLFFVFSISTGDVEEFSKRIVGGTPYAISKVPYQVSIKMDVQHLCGATILTSKFVLTAAHCVKGLEKFWDRFEVRVGSSMTNNDGQTIKIKTYNIHTEYPNQKNWHHDIAILELESEIIFSENAKPIELPGPDTPIPFGKMAVVTGWGALKEYGGTRPVDLQGVLLPILTHEKCESIYGENYDKSVMICAGYMGNGLSACEGDSGGPLVVNGVQFGIASWQSGCGDYPTVFAHVPNLRNYITEIVGI